jgi:hypothetical protein
LSELSTVSAAIFLSKCATNYTSQLSTQCVAKLSTVINTNPCTVRFAFRATNYQPYCDSFTMPKRNSNQYTKPATEQCSNCSAEYLAKCSTFEAAFPKSKFQSFF